jgi:hypothetical protein
MVLKRMQGGRRI